MIISLLLSAIIAFNSIKVRLKHKSDYKHQIQSHFFQFHKGAIETLRLANNLFLMLTFNSIKVRLKRR